MTGGPVLVSTLLLLPPIMQAKVFLVQTGSEKPEMKNIDEHTKDQDYGHLQDFVHDLGFKLEPNNCYNPFIPVTLYNCVKTRTPVKKPVLQPKTPVSRNPVEIPFSKVTPSEGKQGDNKCQRMPPDEKKNTRMERRRKSRQLKGKKLHKVPWGHWVKSSESRTGDRVQTPRKFCCTRGRKVGELVKNISSCRGRQNKRSQIQMSNSEILSA